MTTGKISGVNGNMSGVSWDYEDGAWVYNDNSNDPVSLYPNRYSGNMGYVLEIGN